MVDFEQVAVSGSSGDGILLSDGPLMTTVTVKQSTIGGSAITGISGSGSVRLTVEESVIATSGAAGLWLDCGAGLSGCDCVEKPELTLKKSMIRDNRLAGVALFGVNVSLLDNSVIRGTLPGKEPYSTPGEGGGGLTVAACSNVVARSMLVEDNRSYGALIDHADAIFETSGGVELATSEGLEVSNNEIGVWLNNISADQQVEMVSGLFDGNKGVGVGVGHSAPGSEVMGIPIICQTMISGTQATSLVAEDNGVPGAYDIGHGFSWNDGANVKIDGLTLTDSALASLLINESAGSASIVNGLNASTDKPPVQQNCNGCTAPSGANSITQSTVELHPVPMAPQTLMP